MNDEPRRLARIRGRVAGVAPTTWLEAVGLVCLVAGVGLVYVPAALMLLGLLLLLISWRAAA